MQNNALQTTLKQVRFVYNKQLELKIKIYKDESKNLSQFELNDYLIELKKKYPFLLKLHSQVLQNINQRINLAFKSFYLRAKRGEKPGFPRFKGKNRYDSITYPQSGFSLNDKLYISKIGEINIVKHRYIKGRIKTMTIKRTATNKWFAFFTAMQENKPSKIINRQIVGIDLGLSHFYADSRGNIINNPRYLRNSEQRLIKIQRKHSRKRKGGHNRKKSRLKLAIIHEKITNQRNDFLHKESRKLANDYSFVAVEKLSIKDMSKNRYLAKSIADVSWHKFLQMLAYKVEETGGKLVKINAHGTSQHCICGNKVEKTLAIRTHRCNNCGVEIDRDIMSAIIIEKLAFFGTTAGSAESNAWGYERMLSSVNQELSLHSS